MVYTACLCLLKPQLLMCWVMALPAVATDLLPGERRLGSGPVCGKSILKSWLLAVPMLAPTWPLEQQGKLLY